MDGSTGKSGGDQETPRGEGDEPASPTRTETKRPRRNRKPKGMPQRPLSAYNIFFKQERERINQARREGKSPEDFVLPSEEEQDDHAAKGKKRTPVVFQALARCIGKRWKALPPDERKKYEALAKEEMKKYRENMDKYQQEVIRNTMRGSVAASSPSPERGQSSNKGASASENLNVRPAAAGNASDTLVQNSMGGGQPMASSLSQNPQASAFAMNMNTSSGIPQGLTPQQLGFLGQPNIAMGGMGAANFAMGNLPFGGTPGMFFPQNPFNALQMQMQQQALPGSSLVPQPAESSGTADMAQNAMAATQQQQQQPQMFSSGQGQPGSQPQVSGAQLLQSQQQGQQPTMLSSDQQINPNSQLAFGGLMSGMGESPGNIHHHQDQTIPFNFPPSDMNQQFSQPYSAATAAAQFGQQQQQLVQQQFQQQQHMRLQLQQQQEQPQLLNPSVPDDDGSSPDWTAGPPDDDDGA